MNGFDWDKLHQLIKNTETYLEKGIVHSDDEIKQILRHRAEELANIKQYDQEIQIKYKVLTFQLSQEKYAIKSENIARINVVKNMVSLPSVPDFIAGIVNIRSNIICVIDLKLLLGLPKKPLSKHSKIIILNDDKIKVGFLVDEIRGTRNIILDELQSSSTTKNLHEEYIDDITKDQLNILNVHKILTSEKMTIKQYV